MTSVSQSQQIMESASLHPLMHVPPHVLAVFKITFARTEKKKFTNSCGFLKIRGKYSEFIT